MAYTTKHLTTHEAIADAVFRLTCAIDDADEALLQSSFTPDAVFDTTPMRIFGPHFGPTHGRDAIVKQLKASVFPLDTTHMSTNVRTSVSASDPNRAKLTATALAQHWRPGHGASQMFGSDFLAGNTYDCDLVFDGELWRIERFELTQRWGKGDRGVFDRQTWASGNELVKNSLKQADETIEKLKVEQ